jgi:hypothetical protein
MRYIYFLMILALLITGCTVSSPNTDVDNQQVVVTPDDSDVPDNSTPLSNLITTGYYGKILAGTTTPYVEFNTKDYDRAIADGMIIFLYFHSDSNPISISEELIIMKAFDEMGSSKIIGFRVKYGDSSSNEEAQLAEKFSIEGPHTKVILKDGKAVKTSASSWDKKAYITQIASYLD